MILKYLAKTIPQLYFQVGWSMELERLAYKTPITLMVGVDIVFLVFLDLNQER